MGENVIIVVFAVVVIGGMGSIMGIDHHRLCARRDRGHDQVLLSGSLQHRGIRPHGAGVAGEAIGLTGRANLT